MTPTKLNQRTKRIRILKWALPLLGLAVLSSAFLINWQDNLDIIQQFDENDAEFMPTEASAARPELTLGNSESEVFKITASDIEQSERKGVGYEAKDIEGEFQLVNGNWDVAAESGSTNAKNTEFEFFGDVRAVRDDTYEISSKYLQVIPGQNLFSSHERSKIESSDLHAEADNFELKNIDGGQVLQMKGNVVGSFEFADGS